MYVYICICIYIYVYTYVYIYIYIHTAYHILPIIYCLLMIDDCLLIALDLHMFRHNGYGPGPRTKSQEATGSGPGGPQLFGPRAVVPGPYPYVHQEPSQAITFQAFKKT